VIGYDAGNLVFALSAAVDTLLLSVAVVWAVRGEPVPVRLLAACAIATVLLAAKGIALLELGVSVPFGVMHVLWLDLVVAIPLAAVLLLAGDYHQGAGHKLGEELPALRSLMRRLDAPGGVFAVQGDVESVAETRQVMAGTGVQVLVNEVERVSVGDRDVSIAGIALAYWSRAVGRTLAQLEQGAGDGDVRIALAHRPDAVRRLPTDTRVDLTVAGHTHGGQVQLPLVGPLTISSRVPRRVGAGGLHELDGRWIYVSRGVGAERAQAPLLRLGAVPEVSLITLR